MPPKTPPPAACRRRRLNCLLLAVSVGLKAHAGGTVEASAAGLAPDSGRNLTPALRTLLGKLPAGEPAKLAFTPGRYDFWPEGAGTHFVSCSNNDSGEKAVVFDLADRKNFEIDGHGARFVFHGGLVPVWLRNARQVMLRGFSIDWEKPYLLELTITRSTAGEAEGSVLPGYDYSIRDGLIYFRPEDGLEYPCDRANGFDPVTHDILFGARTGFTFSGIVTRSKPSPYPRPNRRSGDPIATDLGDRTVRIAGKRLPAVPRGTRIAYMNLTARVHRLYPAIVIDRSADVTLDHVEVHSAFGMAMVAQFSRNISLLSYQVTPSDDRFASTRADATHFAMCSGQIRIEECVFKGMLDDATNVHGMWVRLKTVTGSRSILVSRVHIQQETAPFAESGDRIEIRSEGLVPKAESRIVAVTDIGATDIALELSDPLPASVRPGDVLDNLSRQPDVVIRRCVVCQSAGRGFLVSTGGHVVIEDNMISTPLGPGIFIPGNFDAWGESGPVHDVTIRHNEFDDCATVSPAPTAVIAIRPELEADFGAFHENIRIADNKFKSPHNRLIEIRHVRNVVISGNRFMVGGTPASGADVVVSEDASGLVVQP